MNPDVLMQRERELYRAKQVAWQSAIDAKGGECEAEFNGAFDAAFRAYVAALDSLKASREGGAL